MIRAIFLDVDGTLVSFDTHRVPQSAIDALRQVHNSGCKIIIATGRAASDLHEIEEVPFDAVIALNGSDCVLRDGTSVSKKQISDKDIDRIRKLKNEGKSYSYISSETGWSKATISRVINNKKNIY